MKGCSKGFHSNVKPLVTQPVKPAPATVAKPAPDPPRPRPERMKRPRLDSPMVTFHP